MCRSKYNRHKDSYPSKNAQEIRSSFYTHLLVYLMVNSIVIFNSGDHGNWQFMTFFWGLGVLSHYKKSKYAFRKETFACAKSQNDEYVDDIVPPPPTPSWKDRDLV